MKKITSIFSYLLLATVILFTACDPNEEIYEELDNEAEPYSNKVTITFENNDYITLSELILKNDASDTITADIIENNKYFSNDAPATENVPYYLENRFLGYGRGSVAIVTYDYYLGDLTYLNQFGNEEFYELTDEDYEWFGGNIAQFGNFSSSDPPEENLPSFLAENYPSPEEGALLSVRYKYYTGELETRSGFYYYQNGEWKPMPNVYILTSSDYDDMGAPGQYNNFSDDVAPGNYLPIFLDEKYPYSQEGDSKIIVYQYYNGSETETRAKEYHFDGINWVEYVPIETRTTQFIYSEGKWIFDPTVKFTMKSSDYQIVVDAVNEEFGADFVNEFGEGEFYTGANSHYSNFDIRIYKRLEYEPETFEGLSDEEANNLIIQRLVLAMQLLLENKYPEAVPQVSGVDVHYIVTFESYNNDFSRSTWVADMVCVSAGNPPEFELVDNTFMRDGEPVTVPE